MEDMGNYGYTLFRTIPKVSGCDFSQPNIPKRSPFEDFQKEKKQNKWLSDVAIFRKPLAHYDKPTISPFSK